MPEVKMEKKKLHIEKTAVWNLLFLTLGVLIQSSAVYLFEIPNHLSIGGVPGIGVLICQIFPQIDVTDFVLAVNVVLLIVGFVLVGKEFGVKTIYASLLFSVSLKVWALVFPMETTLTGNSTLEFVCVMLFSPLGAAIVYDCKGSTGGTDIIAMILKKYLHINISKGLFVADVAVVMGSAFVFGLEIWIFTALAFVAHIFLIDFYLSFLHASCQLTVVTDPEHANEICRFITEELERTATVSRGFEGAYEKSERTLIISVVSRRQAAKAKRKLASIDSNAFIIVAKTAEILGNGFREKM